MPTAVGGVVVRTGPRSGGPATILLHGAAGSWTTWTPLIRHAQHSGRPLPDVIAIDLPGWGETDPSAANLSVAAMSAVVEQVAGDLGYHRWTVIGHSLGGFVALDLAARRTDATIAVVLVSGTGAAVVDAIRRPVRGGARLLWFAGMLLIMRSLAAFGASPRRVLGLLRALGLMQVLSGPLFANWRSVGRNVADALVDEVRPVAFARAARAAARYDLQTWRGIICPVRSVRGERDVFAGADDGTAFAELILDFREVRLPEAGHFAAIEQPDAVLEVVEGAIGVRGVMPVGG